MNLRGLLFGSKLRIVLVLLVLIGGLVGGAFAAGILGAPSVSGVDNHFVGVEESTTTIETDVFVTNPNPFSASLSGLTVDYDVRMNGITMATGTKEGVTIGKGETAVSTTTQLRNERIPKWWVSHLQNGEQTTLVVNADVHSDTVNRTFDAPPVEREIETDLISSFNSTETRPVNASQPLVSDPVLYINETSAHWGEITEERSTIEIAFTVYNPKTYPITVTKLNYTTTMNNITVGVGETEEGYVIPPRSEETLRASITIDNDRLDEWWVSHLERNQRTDLRIDFAAVIDTGGTQLAIPLDALTYEETMETDIFGNKAEYPTGDGSTASSDASDGSDGSDGSDDGSAGDGSSGEGSTATAEPTTTDDGGVLGDDGTSTPVETQTSSPTATPTPTPTPTPTATPEPTTTDDGGLLGDRVVPLR